MPHDDLAERIQQRITAAQGEIARLERAAKALTVQDGRATTSSDGGSGGRATPRRKKARHRRLPPQERMAQLLYIVRESGELRTRDLARRAGVTGPYLSSLLKQMEQDGQIARPLDRRHGHE